MTIARSLGEFGAVLVVSGNLIGKTQTATLYIHDGIESFHTEGAYAASLVLAAVSFVLLVGMDAIRKRLDVATGESVMSLTTALELDLPRGYASRATHHPGPRRPRAGKSINRSTLRCREGRILIH